MLFNPAIADTNADLLTPNSLDYRALLGRPRLDEGRVQVGARGHRSTEAAGTICLDSSVWDIGLH